MLHRPAIAPLQAPHMGGASGAYVRMCVCLASLAAWAEDRGLRREVRKGSIMLFCCSPAAFSSLQVPPGGARTGSSSWQLVRLVSGGRAGCTQREQLCRRRQSWFWFAAQPQVGESRAWLTATSSHNLSHSASAPALAPVLLATLVRRTERQRGKKVGWCTAPNPHTPHSHRPPTPATTRRDATMLMQPHQPCRTQTALRRVGPSCCCCPHTHSGAAISYHPLCDRIKPACRNHLAICPQLLLSRASSTSPRPQPRSNVVHTHAVIALARGRLRGGPPTAHPCGGVPPPPGGSCPHTARAQLGAGTACWVSQILDTRTHRPPRPHGTSSPQLPPRGRISLEARLRGTRPLDGDVTAPEAVLRRT